MIKCFHPCFKRGLYLAHQRDQAEQEDLATPESRENRALTVIKHRAELLKKMTEAEHRVMARWGPEAAETARRMVTVWLDEVLIRSPWPGREYWLHKPLQSEWGEGRSGGLWFFRELERLNPARGDERELAALALRCVSLGLAGRHGRAPDELNKVRREIQERFGFQDDTPIFPPPLPEGMRQKIIGKSGRRPLAAMAVVPLLLWLLGGLSLHRTLAKIDMEAGSPPALPHAKSLYGDLNPNGPPGQGQKL